jgi:drug/metabolite transporter (DMT)-like permease
LLNLAVEDSESVTKKPQDPESSFTPYAALVAVQLFFGSFPVIGKVVLVAIPSLALVSFRVGIAAIVLYLVQRVRGSLALSGKSDYFRLALLSVFGVSLNQILFVTGLSYTKAANTSLLAVTIPIFTMLISYAVGSERAGWRKIAGIVLAASGVLLLIDPRNASFAADTTVGDILIVCNSLSYGIFVATSKDILTRNGPLRSMVWIFIFANVVTLPLGVYSMSRVDIAGVAWHVWPLVFYIALFGTAIPYLFNAWALARVTPSTVAVFIYLQPVIGFVLAVAFLEEHIDLKFGVAAVLIFIGLFLTTRRETISPEVRKDIQATG